MSASGLIHVNSIWTVSSKSLIHGYVHINQMLSHCFYFYYSWMVIAVAGHSYASCYRLHTDAADMRAHLYWCLPSPQLHTGTR